MLLGAAAVYVCCVYFTGDLIQAVPALRPAKDVEAPSVTTPKKKGKMHGIEAV